jgi:chromosome partitioning protein
MEIISIINQKGGAGKTTTAHALGTGLAKKGFKVLFIDIDGQANLTNTMQAEGEGKILDLLSNKVNINEIIQRTSNGDILAGGEDSFHANVEIIGEKREYRLKESIANLNEKYDYIIIDTPPALDILTINAMVASNSIIITSQAELYNLNGTDRVVKIIKSICEDRNKNLSIKGILLTRFKERTRLNRDFAKLVDEFATKLNTKVYNTTIRDSIVISEAQAMYKSIFDYAPDSNVAKDYEAFVEEFLKQEK